MRLLLDTHTFLWWLAQDRRLSRRAREAVGKETSQVFVSAVTVWEITTKARLGRMRGMAELTADVSAAAIGQGFDLLDITALHAQRAGSMGGPVTDPWDLMLIAQSQTEGLVLISNEDRFDEYGISRIW